MGGANETFSEFIYRHTHTHKKHSYVTSADGHTTKTGVLFCHFHLFSKPMDILNSRLFSGLHLVYTLNLAREG
jgi:hypothetical protein